INRDAKMKMEFHELVHARINSAEPTLDRARHANFYKLHDNLETIRRYRSKLREFKGSTNQRLTDRSSKQVVKDFTDNMLANLDQIDHELKVFEYRYLNSIREGLEYTSERFESEFEAISKRLESAQWNVDSKLTLFEESNELSSLIERLGQYNERFKFSTTMPNGETCNGIMSGLMQNAF